MDKAQYSLMRQIEDSHWWYVGMRRISAALLSGVAWGNGRLRVLDAGCGTGGTTAWLGRYGRVVGIDFSADGLELCQERGLGALARASVQELPFAAASFDLITSFDVLYHLGVHSDADCLREFFRVLRPGGYLLIRLPAYDWLRGAHDRAVHTRHRYTAGELQAKLASVGFTVDKITYANCLLFPLAAAKRLLEVVMPSPDDLRRSGRLADVVLGSALAVEAHLVSRMALPWGLSVVALAKKEAEIASPCVREPEAQPV